MWKTMIYDEIEPIDEWGEINPLYKEWLEKVVEEPWFEALQHLVRWSGIWTGTGEELVEEVKLRVCQEVWESEDFPSTYQKLSEYEYMLDCADPRKSTMILDYRELTKSDLEEFDVPGWGPESPILVERDRAGRKLQYGYGLYRLLCRYRNPLLLAVLNFTHESSKFTKKNRVWTGNTTELAKQLLGYCPIFGGIFSLPSPILDDSEEELKRRCDETFEMLNRMRYSDYRKLAGRMRTCAYILKEFGIKVSWKKVTLSVPDPEGRSVEKLYWTVEAPRWRD